ncbi:amidohydrolase family protein [Nitrincola sp. MINF-07-Sa-05]|uniref:amidohydrolase family protein n=1 Tax=Nitrincola salilacus TaxID=3400273 RepID=UPI003917EDF8
MRIDAHQHFWQIARGDYGWLTPELTRLYRDFLPEDLLSIMAHNGIDGTVLVQAAPTRAETAFMLSLAERHAFIKGVVGWVDFESADVEAEIAQLAVQPKVVGLRPMIQDIPDPDWMLKPELERAFNALIATDLTFDALTLPQHLPNLSRLLQRHPEMRVVIDHASKPRIRSGEFDPWAQQMAGLAANPNAYCKLSGLITEAGDNWTLNDLKPYVDHLLDTFGPQRLIWGSDWPVCLLAGDYRRWLSTTEQLLEGVADTSGIFGGNALRAYRM